MMDQTHNPIIVQLDKVVYTATFNPPQYAGSFMRIGLWTYEKRQISPDRQVLSGGPLSCLSLEGVLGELTAMALREYSL